MPISTIDAYQDHGDPKPDAFTELDIEAAERDLARLADVGVDYQDVVLTLEDEGVEKFVNSWLELLQRVEEA
jgi:transaldolase